MLKVTSWELGVTKGESLVKFRQWEVASLLRGVAYSPAGSCQLEFGRYQLPVCSRESPGQGVLSQNQSTVTALSVVIAVTVMCISLSQHCHYHCCHNAVPVFAVTTLCASVSNRCGIPPV